MPPETNQHITIKLFATLNKFLPADSDRYPIEKGITVGDLLPRLDIPEVKAKLIFVNGKKGDLKTPLQDGDRVGIFPPVGGG
jgi:molybdopterin converting factor small subunit